MIGVLKKRGNLDTETDTQREKTDTQGEDHCVTGEVHLQVKEWQKLPANHQKPERDKEGSTYSFQSQYSPVGKLILDF